MDGGETRILLATVLCALACACGSSTPTSRDEPADASLGDSGDGAAHTDASSRDGAVDAGYVALGTRCQRPSDAGAPDVFRAPPQDDASADGAPPVFPQLLLGDGGVASLPIFVPITFDGDDARDVIEDYVASVGCTSYWRQVVGDYGVGDAISAPPVHLAEPAPTQIDDTEIRTWLTDKLAKNPEMPAATPNTIFLIFYPSTTTVTQKTYGLTSCLTNRRGFGGYHHSFDDVAYAVLPRCEGLDTLEGVAAHELIEAVTDPFIGGYDALDPAGLAWGLDEGSEIGDLCEWGNAFLQPDDYPFTVTRGWSNRAALAGQDPCVPVDGNTFFAARPALTDTVSVDYRSSSVATTGLKLAVGSSTTIDVDMISSGSVPGGWSVSAYDPSRQDRLRFTLDKAVGNTGDTLHLKITRTAYDPSYGASVFVLFAEAQNHRHFWWGIVGDG